MNYIRHLWLLLTQSRYRQIHAYYAHIHYGHSNHTHTLALWDKLHTN